LELLKPAAHGEEYDDFALTEQIEEPATSIITTAAETKETKTDGKTETK
jgi:hypothetical protein